MLPIVKQTFTCSVSVSLCTDRCNAVKFSQFHMRGGPYSELGIQDFLLSSQLGLSGWNAISALMIAAF